MASGTTLRGSTIASGVPEGEEGEQGIENLFEKIMTENFPNLMKELTYKSRKHKHLLWGQDELKKAHTKTYHN